MEENEEKKEALKSGKDLDFDESTGELSLELDVGSKDSKDELNPQKGQIGHVERMRAKREREKLGLDDLEDEVDDFEAAEPISHDDDSTGEIKPEEEKAKVKKTVAIEKIDDSDEDTVSNQEFRPAAMQDARDSVETGIEEPQKKTPVSIESKSKQNKIKNLEDALGLNDEDEEIDPMNENENDNDKESERDAATRRTVLDDLMFNEEVGQGDISSETDTPDQSADLEDLEALISDEDDEEEEYEVEAAEGAKVQVAGSEANFKEEQLNPDASPVEEAPAKVKTPTLAKLKGAHPKCNFCKISQGKFKLAVVYQDEQVIAIMDPKPLTKGQLLVSPKKHAASLTDLEEDEVTHLFSVANKLCKALKNSKVPAEAVSYFLSESVNEELELRHIYLSIIPRTNKDGIGLKYKKKINSTTDDLELICDHLHQYLK